MAYDSDLLEEFISGTAEISLEIETLLEKLPSDTSAKAGSPLSTIHKHVTNFAKSAEFIGLENTAEFLKLTDAVLTAVKDKKIEANEQFVGSMKDLFVRFNETLAKTEDVGLEDFMSFSALMEIVQKIEKGIFEHIEEGYNLPEIDAELLPDFIADTEEQIASAEENFLILGKDGFNQEIVNTAYRNIHSIKGNCGFVHLYQLQDLCHAMETIMGGMREKSIGVNNKNISFLLEFLDEVKMTVWGLEKGGKGVVQNLKALIKKAENTFPAAFGIIVVEEKKEEPKVEEKIEIIEEVKVVEEPKPVEQPKIEEAKVEIKEEIKKEEPKFEPKAEEKIIEKPVEEKKVIEKPKTTKIPVVKADKPVPVIKTTAQMKEEIDKIVVSDDMRQNFISDSREQLSTAEEAFLLLEKNGFNQETINNAYRQIHSFKGNCGFMQLEDLQSVSHTMETIMQSMREQKAEINSKSISFLLKFLDVLHNGVTNLELSGIASIPEAEEYNKKAVETFPECFDEKPVKTAKKATKEIQIQEQDNVIVENLSQMSNNSAIRSNKRQDLRVDLEKLEKIIDLAGELVIAESMVSRNPAVEKIANEGLNRSIYQLRKICNDLQDATMSLRMVPLSGLFKKMTRLVHDLSNHVGKKINLITTGEDTEVDKSVFELINDPLVHIIRNACDHGIGTPKERLEAGKDEWGTVIISGEHRSGAVWISVKDDGRGFNREKILAKAIEQGIISEDEKDFLTDDEICKLVLRPGFSTASIVSDISGRGVGMDVVQKNIESIRGQLFINTKEDEGTEFIIRIPLTLAIIDGMIIKVANSLYIIPTLTIKQSLKYDKNFITYSPEHEEILKYQDKLVPVVRVGNLFNQNITDAPEKGILIVVEEEDNLVALFADDIVGQQQVVIKGLSDYINKNRGASGCTILGDGTVALILDIKTLSHMALEKAKNTRKIPVSNIKNRSK